MQYEEILNELNNAFKGHKILGEYFIDYLNDSEFEELLYSLAQPEIYAHFNFTTGCKHPEYVIFAMTYIALKYYNGNYWDKATEVLNNDKICKSDSVFQSKMRSFIREYDDYNINASRLIEIPVIHAIIPQYFIYNYFVFCYDIYFYNLRCSLKKFSRDDLKFVFDSLKSKMNDVNDNLEIKGLNKTYTLIKTTKKIITTGYGLDSLMNITEKIIRMIDNFYWDKPQPVMPAYYQDAYEKWVKTVNAEEKARSVREAKERTEFVKWTPKFIMINNAIYLETRDDNISDVYDKHKLVMRVYQNGNLIEERKNLRVSDMIGGYRLNSERFKIDYPLDNIRYVLSCGDEIVYDSTDLLYRDFLLFDEFGREVKNHTDKDDDIIAFITKKEFDNKNNSKVIQKEGYQVRYINVNKNSSFLIDDIRVDFVSLPLPGIYGSIASNAYFDYTYDNNIYNNLRMRAIITRHSFCDR